MSGFINVDALEQKLGMLGVSNAYDRPSFWYGKDKKDYKVIPTKYHKGYDNALADVEKAIQELQTIEERKTDTCQNDGKDYAECDQFVCSACGIELQDWNRVERDMDDGEVSYHEYTFRFCPNCGRKIVEGAEDDSN